MRPKSSQKQEQWTGSAYDWRLYAYLTVFLVLGAVVLDLFLNVAAFDDLRPRTRAYNGMRQAAHSMIGERLETTATGRVRDIQGDPIVGATVTLGGSDASEETTTRADGSFHITASGRFGRRDLTLAISHPRYVNVHFVLERGYNELTVVLRDLPVIRGVVTFRDGTVPEEYEVLARPLNKHRKRPTPYERTSPLLQMSGDTRRLTGHGKDFELRDLQPVPYQVIVRAPGAAVVSIAGVIPRNADERSNDLAVLLPRLK